MGQKVKIVQDANPPGLDKAFAICEHLGTMTVPFVMEGSLRVIAKRRLLELAGGHGDCIDQVNAWYSIASKATWQDLSEVRQIFPHADVVGNKTIFNIKGNDYRLIVHILYSKGIIYIRDLLTHAEYNKGSWK